jgi:RNA polymerase sigma factor (sigma-70 family)
VTSEEAELWRRARAGDREARVRLVALHLGLARAVAQRFGGAGPGRDDLAQAAALGLVEAVAAFDPAQGVAFSTFAVPRILGEVRDALRRSSGFGGMRSLAESAAHLRTVEARLAQTLGREPDAAELAAALGWSRSHLAEVASALEPTLPYGPAKVPDVGTPSPEGEIVERLALARALTELPEPERRVIALRYVGRLSQSQVADVVGLAQSQVSRRERRGLRRLWHSLGGERPIHTPPDREAT